MKTLKKALLFPVRVLSNTYYVFLLVVAALVPFGIAIEIISWIRGE